MNRLILAAILLVAAPSLPNAQRSLFKEPAYDALNGRWIGLKEITVLEVRIEPVTTLNKSQKWY